MTIPIRGGSLFPSIGPDSTYLGPGVNYSGSGLSIIAMGGFDNNGDVIELPTSYTGTINYYDSSGNQVTDGSWNGGLTPADVDALVGGSTIAGWTGFHLNDDGSLLYFVAINNTGPVLHLGTINKAGSISMIGSGATFSVHAAADVRWPVSHINRAPDGSGNIFIRSDKSSSTGGTFESELNISTGALVSEHAKISNLENTYWKTPGGLYCGGLTGQAAAGTNSSAGSVLNCFGSSGPSIVNIPINTGVPMGNSTSTPLYVFHWRGRAVLGYAQAGEMANGRAFTYDDFNAFVEDIAQIGGSL